MNKSILFIEREKVVGNLIQEPGLQKKTFSNRFIL